MAPTSLLSPPFDHDPPHAIRRRPGWVLWIATITILATVATACAGSGDDGSRESGSGSIDSPRPMGDSVASGFTYSSGLTDPATVWEGTLLGLVETGTNRNFNQETGRCLVLLGVMTPSQAPEGGNASPFVLPFSVRAGGSLVYPDNDKCDVEAIKGAGYGWFNNADVPVGTPYPFYAEIFLPGDSPAGLDSVMVGNPVGTGNAQYYEPTVVTEIPAPPA